VVVHFAFTPAVNNKSSYCSTTSSAFNVVSILESGHSNRQVVVSRCFSLQFPSYIRRLASFHMLICHLYIFFHDTSVHFLVHFLIRLFIFLLLSFKSSLYTSDNSPLSDMSLQIFLPVLLS